jgi:hypothetical protein
MPGPKGPAQRIDRCCRCNETTESYLGLSELLSKLLWPLKTVPYVPLSHPFVERLVGTLRRECLDRTLFWTTADLESKLGEFQTYLGSFAATWAMVAKSKFQS